LRGAWAIRAVLHGLVIALAGCDPEEGVRAELVVRFEAQETLEATETLEVTIYDASGVADPCEGVLAGATAVLGTMPIAAGPVTVPVRQASGIDLEGVSYGPRLFFASARLPSGAELARGCVVADVGPSGATVAVTMQRVPCDGAGSVPCGPDAVCRDGRTCEDRPCRIEAGPVSLADFPYGLGVGASQVMVVGDGILVGFTGAVGARGGVAIAHLSPNLEALGETTVIDAVPCTWPALVPVDGGALVVWGDCEGPDFGAIRAAAIFADGTPTGDADQILLEHPLRAELEPDQWNSPVFVRTAPTAEGGLAMWQELATADGDPEAGPFQIRTIAIDGDTATMADAPVRVVPASALMAESSPSGDLGAAIQYVDLGTGDCHLAVVGQGGALLDDDVLGGPLASCATVAFGPTVTGYTFLGQEIRRLVPWPAGQPTESLLAAPDAPMARSTFGAFVETPSGILVGWEEHADDALGSRLQVALLGRDGTPRGAAVPFEPLQGEGPYQGFAMAADGDLAYAAWQQGPSGAQRVAVARIRCTFPD
jgi:hypothetical protein